MPWAVAHEQRVVEGLAQAGKGVGYGWLGDADDLPGAGQVGFGIDRIEHDEQVQVDFVQVHGTGSATFLVIGAWMTPYGS